MRRPVLFGMVALALMVAASGASYAQEVSIVNVPFAFVVGSKTMQPGRYEIRQEGNDPISIVPQKGQPVIVEWLTRLAAPETPLTDPKLVFDKVEGAYYLSEVWMPGTDGYMIRDTKAPHTHSIVKARKEKKGG